MSRSGYIDDMDDYWAHICWRGAVKSAIRGRRGQQFLRELRDALDAMPEKRLIAHDLESDGEVCALGALGRARAMDMAALDPEDPETVAHAFGIACAMTREIVFENDEAGFDHWHWHGRGETPERRWERMRQWVDHFIVDPKP